MLEALPRTVVDESLDEPNQCPIDCERKDELANVDVATLRPRRLLFVNRTPNSPEEPLADHACQQTAKDADRKKDHFNHALPCYPYSRNFKSPLAPTAALR
jgi:hypothetical protein